MTNHVHNVSDSLFFDEPDLCEHGQTSRVACVDAGAVGARGEQQQSSQRAWAYAAVPPCAAESYAKLVAAHDIDSADLLSADLDHQQGAVGVALDECNVFVPWQRHIAWQQFFGRELGLKIPQEAGSVRPL